MGKIWIHKWILPFVILQSVSLNYAGLINSQQLEVKSIPQGEVFIQASSISQDPSQQPLFQVTPQRFPVDPYSVFQLATAPVAAAQEAQDRIFDELSAAASIVPYLFGKDKPIWVPHRYFNWCPMIPPDSQTFWGMGCAYYSQVPAPWGPPVPPGSVSTSATTSQSGNATSSASATATSNTVGNGWQAPVSSSSSSSSTPSSPTSTSNSQPNRPGGNNQYGSPFIMNPASPQALGLPPNFPPMMLPFYANPPPPPMAYQMPQYPQIVSNNEAAAVDIGSLFTTVGHYLSSSNGNEPSGNVYGQSYGGGNSIGGSSSAGTSLFMNNINPNQLNGLALYGGYGGAPITPVPVQFALPYGVSLMPVPIAVGDWPYQYPGPSTGNKAQPIPSTQSKKKKKYQHEKTERETE